MKSKTKRTVRSGNSRSFNAWLSTAPKFKQNEVVTLNIELPTEDWLALQCEASKCKQELRELIAGDLHSMANMYREHRMLRK